MTQFISEIMSSPAMTIDLETPIEDLEKFSSKYKAALLPVMDKDNNCFGVISAYDLTLSHARGQNSKLTHAWEICSHRVIQLPPTSTILEAKAVMLKHNIHHICEPSY